MAQELELIVELLREMKRVNNANSEGLDRLLNNIAQKLDTLSTNPASLELTKAYIVELTRNADEKYSATLDKFSDLENAIKTIFIEQQEHVKNKDMKDLFDVFSKNMNGFYTEAKQQKAIIAGIETRLSDFANNKSDKEDILRTINLLRSDFENLNHAYKNTINDIYSSLKSILTNLVKIDQTQINSVISEQLDIIYKSTTEAVSYLKAVEEKDAKLENLLSDVVTNETLKITQAVIDAIIDKTVDISEKLETISDKSDIEGLQAAAVVINNKLDNLVSREDFNAINTQAENLIAATEDVKQKLANITRNIEELPDTNLFENSLHDLFRKFELLSEYLNKVNVKGDIQDVDSKIITLQDELSTIKNIVADLNEIIASRVVSNIETISFEQDAAAIKEHITLMLAELPQKDDIEKLFHKAESNNYAINDLIDKTDAIADRLDALPTHDDMNQLSNNQLGLVENLQGVANKDDIEELHVRADKIEEMIDTLNFDKEFENLYDKTSSVETWLKDSQIQENTIEISEKLDSKSEQKDLLEILNITKQITAELDELSQNADVKKVNRTVSEVYQMLEDLKNDLINTQEIHNDSVIIQLSELQKSITTIVSADEFSNFLEDLKTFISGMSNNTDKITADIGQFQSLQEEIIKKLENIDLSQMAGAIVNEIDTKLTNISEYLNSGIKVDNEAIKNSIAEIKEIIENKKSNFDEVEKENNQIVFSIQKYLNEIKNILEAAEKTADPALTEKITSIESVLIDYQAYNENQFGKILERLNDYENLTNDLTAPIGNITNSLSELKNLKREIIKLSDSFESMSPHEHSTGYDISAFIVGRLNELGENIDTLSNDVANGVQQGFAYNAELLEEKTSIILGFIKELRHASTNELDLYERLTVTDNALIDIQQELELINTDILSDLTSKTDAIIEDLTPIKEMLSGMNVSNKTEDFTETIKVELENLHKLIQEDLSANTKYSQPACEKLEEIYSQIAEGLLATQNNIHDFILSDIDSVIIKIDDLKYELEEKFSGITPPDASRMAELQQFIDEINEFKQAQQAFFADAAEDIKSSITEKMEEHHDEIKSLLCVAANNDEIIKAIEELKQSFSIKFSDLAVNSFEDEFSPNEFEEVFENKNTKVIDEIKDEFKAFSTQISSLSDDNLEIEEVLKSLQAKLDNIAIVNRGDNNSINKTSFDFIKAFDLLKQDIEKLHADIKNTVPDNSVPIVNSGWLDEIKDYIAGSEIKTILEDINSKIDILTLTETTDWVNEIKQTIKQLNIDGDSAQPNNEVQEMLKLINEKIDIIAAASDDEFLEDIRDAAQTSEEIKSLLDTLNKKVDVLAMTQQDASLMDDIKDAVEKSEEMTDLLNILNEKVDIIASSQDTDDFENNDEILQNVEDLKGLMNILNAKVDIIASSPDDKKYFDDSLFDEKTNELKYILEALNNKVDIIASSNTQDDIEDLLTSVSELQNKINAIDFSNDNTKDLEEIKDYLVNLDRKTDILAETDYTDSLEEVKDTVYNIEERLANIDVTPIEESVNKLSVSDAEITSMLEVLNFKIDEISAKDNSDTSKDLEDIKCLLMTQSEYIGKLEKNNKTEAFQKCLKELTLAVNSLNVSPTAAPEYKHLQKSLKEMKESIMAAVVTIFEQVSFVEESEDIKDFVEERTDVINQNLEEVTKQLRQITNSAVEQDYTYSMQDIESDLAKLRIALNELQNNEIENQANELASISSNVHRITSTVQELQNSFTPEEIRDIKSEITNLSIQTQEILDKTSNTDFEGFGRVITTHLANKVDRVTDMLEKSSVSDKVMRQALIYMGEWIDSASESMNKISTNSDEIVDVKNTIEILKHEIPEQTDILNSIEEKFDEQQERLSYFEKQINKLGNLEEKFEQQQERIDRLEMSIEKILNAVEDIDDSRVTKKIDKLDKQLAKLSINIEKLASYVD